MSDWGPVFISVVLFILLSPGLIFQLPGHTRFVNFGNFQTSGASIFLHSIIYFAFICIFLLAVRVHMYIAPNPGPLFTRASKIQQFFLYNSRIDSKRANADYCSFLPPSATRSALPSKTRRLCFLIRSSAMGDWAPVVIGVVLFILLSPGLLFQLPGNNRHVEFGSFHTNGKAIAVHTLIFFAVFTILILAVGIHIYTG
ncbi:uncharacterized protein LOC131238801 [Magnolia sinica]|uniref:uncharacterized protein LOC131238801 n=1 Tax=Magnolia sinica TaxID=86752 RepID=UPI00265B3FA2|nr:uncharacterized protein LOC131238801 [Magnolia sinica]